MLQQERIKMRGDRKTESFCLYILCVRGGVHHRRPWHTLNLTRVPDDQKDEVNASVL